MMSSRMMWRAAWVGTSLPNLSVGRSLQLFWRCTLPCGTSLKVCLVSSLIYT
ncbi:unnamed protein product [Prunus brigantina]